MNDKKHIEYLDNIEKFLNSDDSFQFSSEHFAKTIVDNV